MKKKFYQKPEVIVFLVLAAVIIIGSLVVNPPMTTSSLPNLGSAHDFTRIDAWINSKPLTMNDLKGKVVLVDFWTYSCINCIRTLPYLNDWYAKYAQYGFVIVGVHTPEFDFEKDYNNVLSAVNQYGIKYPVALDNSHGTWDIYQNQYWPRHYLIDKNGVIREDHIGEGGYAETEKSIQELLGIKENMTSVAAQTDFSQIGTPEIYLGYSTERQPFGNGLVSGTVTNYNITGTINSNTVYLSGQWLSSPDNLMAVNNSKIFLLYKAKDVNIVAGGSSMVTVLLDKNPIQKNYFGRDASADGTITTSGNRLYNVISAPAYGVHLLELDATPGLQLYTFTFG